MTRSIPPDEIDRATEVLRAIAREHNIDVRFGEDHWNVKREGDAPTIFAYLVRLDKRLTACTHSPAATPNVIEPLMHEMAHAVVGLEAEVEACRLVVRWADRIPGELGEHVWREARVVLDEAMYDSP